MVNKKILSILSVWLLLIIMSGCGGGGGVSGSTGSSAKLLAISITPSNPQIAMNTSQPFTAIGVYSDDTTQDLTDAVTWSSSDTNVSTVSVAASTSTDSTSATLGGKGRRAYAYGKNAGSTTITATSGSTSGSTTLTVTNATLMSLVVTPANPSIAMGSTQQLKATGTFSNNTTQDLTTQVVWSSSNTGIVTIDAGGLATSVAAGSITGTATSGSTSGSITITVNAVTLLSISVTPANPSIAMGSTQQLKATGTFSDNTMQDLTTQVVWSSFNTSVATVNATGLAKSVAAGSTTITAALGSISGFSTLTVTTPTLSSISVTPANPSIASGATQQFSAFGVYSDGTTQVLTGMVTWGSSNIAVATISNTSDSNGLASGVAAGTTTIKATSGGISGSAILTITATSSSHSYSTNFSLTENPISEGGNWINGEATGLDWGNVRTTTGIAYGTSTSANYSDPTAILVGTWSPDQYAQGTAHVTGTAGSAAPEVELRLRTNISAHSITGYECDISTVGNPQGTYAGIVRWNGPLGNFTYIGPPTSVPYNAGNGDVFRCEVTGQNPVVIKLYKNGSLILNVSDSSTQRILSGNPGIGFDYGSNGTDVGWSSFTAGEL